MCCRKIDEDDNDAGIEEPTEVDVEVKPCSQVKCFTILFMVLMSTLLWTIYENSKIPPACTKVSATMTDSDCSYQFDNVIVNLPAQRNVEKKIWSCHDQCVFNVNNEYSIANCGDSCRTIMTGPDIARITFMGFLTALIVVDMSYGWSKIYKRLSSR